MTRRLLLAVFLAGVAACAGPVAFPGFPTIDPPPPARAPSSGRLTAFISDLHLGVGTDPSTGRWHPFEDFRWQHEFGLFLEALDAEGRGRTDLVFTGDTFELWQSLDGLNERKDCLRGKNDLGVTQADVRPRLARVTAQHGAELRALRKFADSGDNTVTILPGNHDAALLFPDVRGDVHREFQSPRVRIQSAGSWVSTDGRVYAEHGHQIGEEVNRFEGWPQPFLQHRDRVHLRRPWGEQFVQCYYNNFEERYPIIDNITREAEAVRFAVAAEGRLRAAVAVGGFLRFFLLGTSAAQLRQGLGQTKQPVWNVAAERAKGPAFLVESLANDDPMRSATLDALTAGALAGVMEELSEDDIRTICDRRADLVATGVPGVTKCAQAGGGLGAIAQALFSSRDRVFGAHLKAVSDALGQGQLRFDVFVYGHTHRAEDPFRPLAAERLGWNPWVFNTGAWQRVITPAELTQEGIPASQVLRRQPEALPACYTVVLVRPYSGGPPTAETLGWRFVDGVWKFGEPCAR
jgi:UDP-2,3-diacylglucosamine pyrophosphatase LpxH